MRTETLTLDLPCMSGELILPTLKVRQVNSLTVDGTEFDTDNIRISADAPGVISTKNRQPWAGYRWDTGYGLIELNLTHGHTAAEAEDFREAVLTLVDQASLAVGTGASGTLTTKTVDDVTYGWSNAVARAPLGTAQLDQFRLLAFA